jgi:hypothetical protein
MPLPRDRMGLADGALQGASLGEDQDALDQLGKLMKGWDDRLSLQHLALSKRYVEGTLNILIEASWASVKFCAIGRREDTSGACGHAADLTHHLPELKAPVWHEPKGHCGARRDVERDGCSWDDAIVLVKNIQLVQVIQGGVPSTITLQSRDARAGSFADAIYFSYGTGWHAPGLVEGKAAVRSWSLVIGSNQVADKKVEGAAQVVDGISDDSAKFGWGCTFLDQAKNVLSGLRVLIDSDFVRLAFVELPDSRLKITDVMFGPFKF